MEKEILDGAYRVKEIFVSVKGEGRWMGYPMIFIRLAECNLACRGCDTDFGPPFKEMETWEIIKEVKRWPQIQRIVITGGEPTLQPLYDLGITLYEMGYMLHLETNGAKYQTILENFQWIALSPKSQFEPKVLALAHEVKVPITKKGDFEHAETLRAYDTSQAGKLWYLHPWNDLPGDLRTMESVNRETGRGCVEYAISTGRWLVSTQIHKYLGIK